MSATPPILDSAGLVNTGWDLFSSKANSAVAQALALAGTLGEFNISPVTYDVSFTPPSNNDLVFNRPQRPDEPIFDYQVDLPEPLNITIPSLPNFEAPPEFNKEAPDLDFSGMPGAVQFTTPPNPPTLDEVEIPDAPVIQMPDLPIFEELALPSPPVLDDIEFLGVRPGFSGVVPTAGLNFVEPTYTSEQLTKIQQEIQRILNDGTGMPAVVEQMLVDRLVEREERESARLIDTAADEIASRGFSLPPGVLLKRIDEVRQKNADLRAARHREVYLSRRQEEVQNFQFAISQGIALENVLINLHLAIVQRSFEVAQFVVNLQYRQLEATIAVYNAAIQGYQADASVFASLIQSELTKLENYRLTIQAEALKQEIDKNKVAIYTAQIEALRTVVEVYRGQIEAAKAVAEKNASSVRAYVGLLDGIRLEIEGAKAESQIWATKIQGQLGKVQAFEAESRAFLATVQAYEVDTRAKTVVPDIQMRVEDLRLRELAASLEVARSKIQSEGQRASALASVFGSKAQIYSADGQIATNESAARDRNFRSAVESRRLEAEQALAKANLDVEQVLRAAQILVSALTSSGTITSQVGSAAMAAVNLSAGIRGTENTNYEYRF